MDQSDSEAEGEDDSENKSTIQAASGEVDTYMSMSVDIMDIAEAEKPLYVTSRVRIPQESMSLMFPTVTSTDWLKKIAKDKGVRICSEDSDCGRLCIIVQGIKPAVMQTECQSSKTPNPHMSCKPEEHVACGEKSQKLPDEWVCAKGCTKTFQTMSGHDKHIKS